MVTQIRRGVRDMVTQKINNYVWERWSYCICLNNHTSASFTISCFTVTEKIVSLEYFWGHLGVCLSTWPKYSCTVAFSDSHKLKEQQMVKD